MPKEFLDRKSRRYSRVKLLTGIHDTVITLASSEERDWSLIKSSKFFKAKLGQSRQPLCCISYKIFGQMNIANNERKVVIKLF